MQVTNSDMKTVLTRRDKNDYYLGIARSVAFGSKCPDGKQHASLAVKHGGVVSQGYNGPAAGQKHCRTCALEECKRRTGKKDFSLCPAVHSEINCIITAARIGTALLDAVFYVTKEPCADCLKALRNMHLSGVVFLDDITGSHWLLEGPRLIKRTELTYRGT
jgi:dCMP deaminase